MRQLKLFRWAAVLTLAILLCTSAAARAFAAASLTPLGFLPGHSWWSEASGVSGDGSVVVGTSASTTHTQPFYWTADGGMVGLGDLYPGPGGGSTSGLHGVSADGSVIVGESRSGSGFVSQAFRWTSGGGMIGLGHLPGGIDSGANGVSVDGSVIVGENSSGSGTEAFRWTASGGMQGLGDLPGGLFYSSAGGVSADGSVIVGFSDSASSGQAFRWTSDGGMVALGDLPGGEVFSTAMGVSADGSVIVGASSSASGAEAFRWTSDGGMVGLGHLVPSGLFGSEAYDVSADGSVIVGSSNDIAFRWTAASGMERLWDVLLANGVDPAADGWTALGWALGISADGNTIVGHGQHNGNIEAFVAVIPTIVPEPATGALALLGVSSILLLRRRSLGRPNKHPIAGHSKRSNPMTQLKLFRWAAALTLAIALAPGAASAQEDGTLTISSTFYMDWLGGTVGPDLAEVFANGHEHTWTLTLYGTSQSHQTFPNPVGVTNATEIHATSFDFEFFGPDAAMLNGIVSEHIAGGDVFIYLENSYTAFGDFATMYVWPMGPDMEFFSGTDMGVFTLFPSDVDGYPVVGPDPFSIWNEYSALVDNRPGNNGYIQSRESLVTFEVSVGPLPGDFNVDGNVDGRDFLAWQRGGSPSPLSATDLADWQGNYGAGSLSGVEDDPARWFASPVPEPSIWMLLALAAMGSGCTSRRRIAQRISRTH